MADEIAELRRGGARRRWIIGISGVLLLGLGAAIMLRARWLEAPDRRTPTSTAQPGPPALIALAGDAIDPDACAGPALRELTKHPSWSFTLAERESTDVVGPDPDETLQTVVIDAHAGTWRDGDLPQTLALDPAERTDLLAAAGRSCREIREGNGFTAHYVVLSYGAVASGLPERDARAKHDALRLPSESRAALDTISVMNRVRARYVATRIGLAETLTLTLHGPRRRPDTHAWAPYTVTLRPDGRIIDQDGDELDSRHEPADHVDLLDWAMQLPATARGPRPLTGTLEIAGQRRPVALQLDTMARKVEDSSPWHDLLRPWWPSHPGPRAPSSDD